MFVVKCFLGLAYLSLVLFIEKANLLYLFAAILGITAVCTIGTVIFLYLCKKYKKIDDNIEKGESGAREPLTQTMADLQRTIITNQDQGLESLLKLMDDETKEHEVLLRHQKETTSLIKELTDKGGNQHTLTKCLRIIVCHAEYISKKEHIFEWTEEYISTLKHLLEKEANPQWQPQTFSEVTEKEELWSAQLLFFRSIPTTLVYKNKLFSSLYEIIPLFKSHKYVKFDNRTNLLHALLDLDWKWYDDNIESLPSNFFNQYKQIISKVTVDFPVLTKMKDESGKTPLQAFVEGIHLHEHVLENTKEIVQLLSSEKNLG